MKKVNFKGIKERNYLEVLQQLIDYGLEIATQPELRQILEHIKLYPSYKQHVAVQTGEEEEVAFEFEDEEEIGISYDVEYEQNTGYNYAPAAYEQPMQQPMQQQQSMQYNYGAPNEPIAQAPLIQFQPQAQQSFVQMQFFSEPVNKAEVKKPQFGSIITIPTQSEIVTIPDSPDSPMSPIMSPIVSPPTSIKSLDRAERPSSSEIVKKRLSTPVKAKPPPPPKKSDKQREEEAKRREEEQKRVEEKQREEEELRKSEEKRKKEEEELKKKEAHAKKEAERLSKQLMQDADQLRQHREQPQKTQLAKEMYHSWIEFDKYIKMDKAYVANAILEGLLKCRDSEGYYIQGQLHRLGYVDGVASWEKAYKFYSMGAKQGHSRCRYYVALCLHQGYINRQDHNLANRYYLSAGNSGVQEAMAICGDMYKFGICNAKHDMESALYWYRNCASAEDVDDQPSDSKLYSLFRLGLEFMNNRDENDQEYAFTVLRQASKHFYGPALFAFSECIKKGIGCEADPKLAERVLEQAELKGFKTEADVSSCRAPC